MIEGIPADFRFERAYRERHEDNQVLLRQAAAEVLALGASWLRFTAFDERRLYLIEGWRVQPDREGPALLTQ